MTQKLSLMELRDQIDCKPTPIKLNYIDTFISFQLQSFGFKSGVFRGVL